MGGGFPGSQFGGKGGSGGGGGEIFTEDIPVVLPAGESFGKWTNGETIPAIGKTANQVIIEACQATLYPTLTPPSAGLSLAGTGYASLLEVGFVINSFLANATFNRGSINPQYTSASPYRSGLPSLYTYSGKVSQANASTSLTNSTTPASVTVALGTNTVNVAVNYDAGVQPKDSEGGDYSTPLPAGTSNASASFTGIYPYFYGKVASGGAPAGSNRPTADQSLINSGTKVVAVSTGTIIPNFGSTSDDYIWFAIPATSTSKTKWYVDALNNGSIGGAVTPGGNLFPDFDSLSVTTVLWSGISYKVYISNYQTAASAMEMRNS